jgi:hypothetical protein
VALRLLVQGLHPPQDFEVRHFVMVSATELIYGVEVIFNGMISLLNFVEV